MRGDAAWLDAGCGRVGGSGASALLLGDPDGMVGSGGGYGDMESAVTEADGWAL